VKKLKGFIQSGIIFIGDPSYMSGPVEYTVTVPGGMKNKELTAAQPVVITPDDPHNPFRKFEQFTASLGEQDKNLTFYGTPDEGMGVAVQTNRISGQYEIERIEDAWGKLLELRIKFKD
jgi:hypothetical protein